MRCRIGLRHAERRRRHQSSVGYGAADVSPIVHGRTSPLYEAATQRTSARKRGRTGSIMVRIRYCALVLAVASIGAFGAGAARADGEWTPVGISDLQGEADWTGFYIGGKLGGSSSNISWTSPAANLFDPLGSLSPVDFSPSGFVGGIIGGGNLQVGH